MNNKELLYLRAKREYYNSDSPIMSDTEFDELEEELISEGSTVVANVGAELSGTLTKVKHSVPMKSLKKIKIDKDDFEKNLDHWVNTNNIKDIEASIKLDGNAVKLIYDHEGSFVCALSRGDGEVGFDISDKLIHMGIPMTINNTDLSGENKIIEIYGEAVIPLSTFEEKYAEEYKNARNFVSGRLAIDLSKYDDDETEYHVSTFKDLHFVPIDMAIINDGDQNYIDQPYAIFSGYFPHMLHFNFFNPKNNEWKKELREFIENLRDGDIKIDYLYDGIVLREMSSFNRSQIGDNNHHPKWAVALKYKSETATTRLIDIEWNIGTNRKLTPVGILEPVELMGTTVQRVSLANLNTMVDKGIVPNSTLTIQKSGDIIPFVISCTPPAWSRYVDNPYWLITDFSYITMEDLEWDDDDPYNVRYVGESDEVEKRKLYKGIKVLDIDNIGEATVELLYDSGIKNIFDVFNEDKFNKRYLIESGNFKEGRALDIIIDAVWNKDSFDYWRVINSLQVEGCGKTMSKELAKYYRDIEPEFAGLEKEVLRKMCDPESRERQMVIVLTMELITHGFDINYPEDKSSSDKEIYTFEMTGSPKEFGWKTKKEFTDSLSDSVEHTKLTKDTNYLITDDVNSNSGKMKKAKKYGTIIVDYEQFHAEFYG